jgi:hypothetical protein
MEAACLPETSKYIYRLTLPHIPEDSLTNRQQTLNLTHNMSVYITLVSPPRISYKLNKSWLPVAEICPSPLPRDYGFDPT